MNSSWY